MAIFISLINLNCLPIKKKYSGLKDFINLISNNQAKIISENQKDLKKAKLKKSKENLIKRLLLDKKKILQIINSIKKIISFKDPVDQVLKKWKRSNGLLIEKKNNSYWCNFCNL